MPSSPGKHIHLPVRFLVHLERELYRHAQSAKSLLPHGHGHALLLCSGLPAGSINLLVHIRVFSQGLQQVLSQGPNALVAGYLL